MESVDYCPMGNILTKTFGGKPKQAAVFRDVVLWKVSSSWGADITLYKRRSGA
jgi:hypothetical protein